MLWGSLKSDINTLSDFEAHAKFITGNCFSTLYKVDSILCIKFSIMTLKYE